MNLGINIKNVIPSICLYNGNDRIKRKYNIIYTFKTHTLYRVLGVRCWCIVIKSNATIRGLKFQLTSFPICERRYWCVFETTTLIQGTGFVISLCWGRPKIGPPQFTRNTASVYVRQMQRGGKMPPPFIISDKSENSVSFILTTDNTDFRDYLACARQKVNCQ